MTAIREIQLKNTTRKRVLVLTQLLRGSWKKSVESVFETGKHLKELKELLPRKHFTAHIKSTIGLSEKHAMRIIAVYERFGKLRTDILLNAKPTVLYQLAYTCTDSQISALKQGHAIQTASGKKSISQLKVSDLIKPKKIKKIELSRELATFFEETQDEISRFEKIITNRKPLIERLAIKETVKETMECLRSFNQKL